MCKADDQVILGVSGGADSICLFYTLKKLSERIPLHLRVAHVHHGIREEEADRDCEFVKKLCEEWEVPFHLKKANVPEFARERHLSEEEAGRLLRYEWFRELKEKYGADRIAVAHQKEDSAETVLLHLFRGSSLRGLAGIRPVQGDIIRPLLCLTRADIREILSREGIPFVEDSTNASDAYERNRVRHHILEYAEKEIRKGAAEKILLAAERAAEADDYLTRKARSVWPFVVQEKNDASGQGLLLRKEAWEEQDPVIFGYLLRLVLEELTKSQAGYQEPHIRALQELAGKQTGKNLSLPAGIRAERGYEGILFYRKPERSAALPESPVIPLETDGKETLVGDHICLAARFPFANGKNIPKNPYTKWFDYYTITQSLVFRHRRPGDYITIAPAGRKSLKSLLIDRKVPSKERDSLWLLADGSHILWIVGMQISEKAKVTQKTVTILECKWSGMC